MLSAHTWAVIGLCCLPLLSLVPLWLLDAGRVPDNAIVHEQEAGPRPDPDDTGDGTLAAAA